MKTWKVYKGSYIRGEVQLSPVYGVNSSIEVCERCQQGMDIAILGLIYEEAEDGVMREVRAPKRICLGNKCDKCTKQKN
jgi:hypothetical protein